MPEDEPRLEEIGDAECRRLLGGHNVGRIGVVVDGWPVVLPVNYVFDGHRVAIRSDPGSKLTASDLGRVAFEIDGIDEGGRRGWSVLVQGRGFDITESLDEVSELMRALPVDPWAPGQKAHWIRIDPERVTGRRLR
ncbi:MAG TPA: pyridoxamine 5'-phosphate oxidase family protein [Acidimicrobiales bacterium]|nr:pyridoxamine 5'-phosphate oxidase family protein [Acidimicrobiales bacterium]